MGFCFGGYISNMLAAVAPDMINAAVPFFGTTACAELTAKVRGPLMIQFAAKDERVNASWPEYEATLKANKANYQAFCYPDTNHGFHNGATSCYDEAAAELAWSRTLAFFTEHLS